MRDSDIERLFERVGDTARPDAEFEEDLLLRLEARLRDELEAGAELDPSSTPLAPAIEVEFTGEHPGSSHSTRNPLLAVAAGIIAIAGLAGLFLAVRPTPADPVSTLPEITTPTAPPDRRDGLGDVCVRHAERLAEIGAMGAPLDEEVPPDDRLAILNELAGIVGEHLAATATEPTLDRSIIEELTSLERDISNALVFANRDRPDGSRYVIPTTVGRILAIDEQLAQDGVTSCE